MIDTAVLVTLMATRALHKYVVGSKSFRPDQLFKVTKKTLPFFNIVSHYFNTLFNWYINLTIDGTIYPSQYFPFGAGFVRQAGNVWTYYVFTTDTGVSKYVWVATAFREKKMGYIYFRESSTTDKGLPDVDEGATETRVTDKGVLELLANVTYVTETHVTYTGSSPFVPLFFYNATLQKVTITWNLLT